MLEVALSDIRSFSNLLQQALECEQLFAFVALSHAIDDERSKLCVKAYSSQKSRNVLVAKCVCHDCTSDSLQMSLQTTRFWSGESRAHPRLNSTKSL
jgi:hypothetical protein